MQYRRHEVLRTGQGTHGRGTKKHRPEKGGGISDGGLNPATDTNKLCTVYRGGSHTTSDVLDFCLGAGKYDNRN